MQEFLYKRNLEENRQKEESIDEMLAVVYHYAAVIEKWQKIKFISDKEKTEMLNKLQGALTIIKKRKLENRRKISEKTNILDGLNKMIDKYDEDLQSNHKDEL